MNRTVALLEALREVYAGAEMLDAQALEDQLTDRGFELVVMSPVRTRAKRRHREAS